MTKCDSAENLDFEIKKKHRFGAFCFGFYRESRYCNLWPYLGRAGQFYVHVRVTANTVVVLPYCLVPVGVSMFTHDQTRR